MMRLQQLVGEVADAFNVCAADLINDRRIRFLAEARFALYKALHDSGHSLRQISHMLGRDHKTIVHGIKRANDLITRDDGYADRYAMIMKGNAAPRANERGIIISFARDRAKMLLEYGDQLESWALEDFADALERMEHVKGTGV